MPKYLEKGDGVKANGLEVRYVGAIYNSSVISFELINIEDGDVFPLNISLAAYMNP